MATNQPKRLQFTLKTLLYFMACVSLLVCVLSEAKRRADRQQSIAAKIDTLGGVVLYRLSPLGSVVPSHLHKVPYLKNYLKTIDYVRFSENTNANTPNRSFLFLNGLHSPSSFHAIFSQDFDNSDISILTSMDGAEDIFLHGTSVSDDGIKSMHMPLRFHNLGIGRTSITPAGLDFIVDNWHVDRIDVCETSITAEQAKTILRKHNSSTIVRLDNDIIVSQFGISKE